MQITRSSHDQTSNQAIHVSSLRLLQYVPVLFLAHLQVWVLIRAKLADSEFEDGR